MRESQEMTCYAPNQNLFLIYQLRQLRMASTILHIGTHPDDEDIGMMTYMSRKYGAQAVYWSATRGEGAQNRVGSYNGKALGVYRTWESLEARRLSGGESLFGPFIDFGFSKSAQETLQKWGRQNVLREIVRAIRLVQPALVISRWQGTTSDGHGHHCAIGKMVQAAFEAAADPQQFPELRKQNLAAWQPRKLYYSLGGDWQPGEDTNFGKIIPEYEEAAYVRLNTGQFDPAAGLTYQEQAWIGFNSHKTQAMGFIPEAADFYYYYVLQKSLGAKTAEKQHLLDGFNPTLSGLADYPGQNLAALRAGLLEAQTRVEEAIEHFRVDEPLQTGYLLLRGHAALGALQDNLTALDLGSEEKMALANYLHRKIDCFAKTAAQCLGLRLEALSEHARITPGQQFNLTAKLWNGSKIDIDDAAFSLCMPPDWQASQEQAHDLQTTYRLKAAENTRLSSPYWLRQPSDRYRYQWPDGEPASRPFGPEELSLTCELAISGHKLKLNNPVIMREAFAGGYRELPVSVIPPISLHPHRQMAFCLVQPHKQTLSLQVVAKNNAQEEDPRATLSAEIPPDWSIYPQEVALAFNKGSDTQTVQFLLHIPADQQAGIFPINFHVTYCQRDYAVMLDPVRQGAPGLPALPDETTCIRERFIISPATTKVQLLDIVFESGLKYAYLAGASCATRQALAHLGLDFYDIADQEIGYIDLNQFNAVVISANAYLVREPLREYANRFLEYVEQGGTLIVEYQGYGYQDENLAPYPFRYHQPHDRVTDENAPLHFLAPEHIILNKPNPIKAADFEGWVQERGLYFFGEWDKRYQPILACHDEGEEPQAGGLLIAGYGQGTYVYAAYSFFRQLPAGVAGAFRLFANLLSLPMWRILERVEILQTIPLFALIDTDTLHSIARNTREYLVEAGEIICRQGDCGQEMYIVLEGNVEIIDETTGKLIATRGIGEVIGELAILADIPRTATIKALDDVLLLVLSGEQFRVLIAEHPEMAKSIIETLVNKLIESNR